MSRRWLYQLTHVEVMSSRSVMVRIGPVRNGEPGDVKADSSQRRNGTS